MWVTCQYMLSKHGNMSHTVLYILSQAALVSSLVGAGYDSHLWYLPGAPRRTQVAALVLRVRRKSPLRRCRQGPGQRKPLPLLYVISVSL